MNSIYFLHIFILPNLDKKNLRRYIVIIYRIVTSNLYLKCYNN